MIVGWCAIAAYLLTDAIFLLYQLRKKYVPWSALFSWFGIEKRMGKM